MRERKPYEELVSTPIDTTVVGSRILVYEEVASTIDHSLRLGGHGVVVVADRQTAGRGRRGRSWHSAPGLGLWFSVAFERPLEGLTFAAALAVRDGARAWCPLTVKWPND
ncbi:MAG: biotin--[acetyl-CoA-carboxylase] ligase, partial [bacterium]|nr:biotin--[acetyl-CoA-carboxylase] ligase [bacterium]